MADALVMIRFGVAALLVHVARQCRGVARPHVVSSARRSTARAARAVGVGDRLAGRAGVPGEDRLHLRIGDRQEIVWAGEADDACDARRMVPAAASQAGSNASIAAL